MIEFCKFAAKTAFLGLVVAACFSGAHAQERSIPLAPGTAAGIHFRSVVIDTSPLAAKGRPHLAEALQQALAGEVRRSFADRIAPADKSAPILVVRIDSIALASFVGGGSGRRKAGSQSTDYLEGAGLIEDARGALVASYPMLSALNASYSGAWYLPDIDARRLDSIAGHFAYWLRREMGV